MMCIPDKYWAEKKLCNKILTKKNEWINHWIEWKKNTNSYYWIVWNFLPLWCRSAYIYLTEKKTVESIDSASLPSDWWPIMLGTFPLTYIKYTAHGNWRFYVFSGLISMKVIIKFVVYDLYIYLYFF